MIDFLVLNKGGKKFCTYHSNKIQGVSYEVKPSIHLYFVYFKDQYSYNRRHRHGERIYDCYDIEEARRFIAVHEAKTIALYNYYDAIGENYYFEQE